MVEVDPRTPLTGADGPVPLIDVFDGRSQLIAYFHMWHTGRPAAEQCEGCTFNTSHITELAYLHSRDVSYAVFCDGPYEEARSAATWCLTARAAIALHDHAVVQRALAELTPAAAELAGAGSGLVTLGPVARHLDDLRSTATRTSGPR
jgi:hypothetical protein